jgi:hypothetical protein
MTGRLLVRAALTLVVIGSVAHAQSPLQFSVAGGASLPTSQFNNTANTGWHAQASIGLTTLTQPIGLRADVAHNRFTAKSIGPDQALTSATLNLTYRLPMTNSALSPYVITGAGAYRLECFGNVSCGPTTRFGWNAGLGTKIAALGMKWFVESRFHAVNANTGNARFVPFTFGLTL